MSEFQKPVDVDAVSSRITPEIAGAIGLYREGLLRCVQEDPHFLNVLSDAIDGIDRARRMATGLESGLRQKEQNEDQLHSVQLCTGLEQCLAGVEISDEKSLIAKLRSFSQNGGLKVELELSGHGHQVRVCDKPPGQIVKKFVFNDQPYAVVIYVRNRRFYISVFTQGTPAKRWGNKV